MEGFSMILQFASAHEILTQSCIAPHICLMQHSEIAYYIWLKSTWREQGTRAAGLFKLAMAWSLLWAVVSLIEVVSRCVQRCVLTRPCSGWKHIHFPNVTISVIEYRLHTINWKNNTSKVEKDIACTCVCYCRKWRQFKCYAANWEKPFIERTHFYLYNSQHSKIAELKCLDTHWIIFKTE